MLAHTMAEALVIRPGLLTTVQDVGRWGFQSRGVPVAGPMDSYAHRLANAFVGNAAESATLEVTLVGPELEFDDERVVAVAGARFEVTVDGHLAPMNAPFPVFAGSRLTFGARVRGARAYVAISGGIGVMKVFGSRATHVGSRMGGVDGRPLEAGDRLPLGDPAGPSRSVSEKREHAPSRPASPAKTSSIRGMTARVARLLGARAALLGRAPSAGHAPDGRDMPDGHARVRVLLGPQHDCFTDEALRTLEGAPYRISQQSDRMGFRLEGAPLTHSRGADIISDATPMGALQVPGSGLPILLMADRQTTGGYPKIATLITADLRLAGQLAPGDTISFAVCSPGEAMAALIAQERRLMAVERPEVA